MSKYIESNGSLTEAGLDLSDHLEKLFTSIAVEHGLSPAEVSYIGHLTIESMVADMVLDSAQTQPKRICLFPEVA
jgi:hypothetical protein